MRVQMRALFDNLSRWCVDVFAIAVIFSLFPHSLQMAPSKKKGRVEAREKAEDAADVTVHEAAEVGWQFQLFNSVEISHFFQNPFPKMTDDCALDVLSRLDLCAFSFQFSGRKSIKLLEKFQ